MGKNDGNWGTEHVDDHELGITDSTGMAFVCHEFGSRKYVGSRDDPGTDWMEFTLARELGERYWQTFVKSGTGEIYLPGMTICQSGLEDFMPWGTDRLLGDMLIRVRIAMTKNDVKRDGFVPLGTIMVGTEGDSHAIIDDVNGEVHAVEMTPKWIKNIYRRTKAAHGRNNLWFAVKLEDPKPEMVRMSFIIDVDVPKGESSIELSGVLFDKAKEVISEHHPRFIVQRTRMGRMDKITKE